MFADVLENVSLSGVWPVLYNFVMHRNKYLILSQTKEKHLIKFQVSLILTPESRPFLIIKCSQVKPNQIITTSI